MDYKIQDKIAQMFLVGIPNKESIPGVLELIKKHHIGGVILYKNNYNNIDEMIDLINRLKRANKEYTIPLTIAIDQEGGRVNRLPQDILNIKSAYRLAKSGKNAVNEASLFTSKLLKDIGINMNFSPVLDIKSQGDDNAFIGNRAFSNNPDEIIKYGEIWTNNYINNDVIPVIKHYPGHGNLNVDSHIFLPIIKNFSKDRIDLKPFRSLMQNKIPAIMVGHILISNYTKLKPASLSKEFIIDFIRNEEKYDGLVITDELGMRAVRIFFGKYRSIKMAYLAGNDIICCKYSNGYIEKCLNIIRKNIEESTLNSHFNRIVSYKKRFNFKDDLVSNQLNISEINKKIEQINEM